MCSQDASPVRRGRTYASINPGLGVKESRVSQFANLETRDAELGAPACAERADSDYRVVAVAIVQHVTSSE